MDRVSGLFKLGYSRMMCFVPFNTPWRGCQSGWGPLPGELRSTELKDWTAHKARENPRHLGATSQHLYPALAPLLAPVCCRKVVPNPVPPGRQGQLTVGEEAGQVEDLPPQHIGPDSGGHWLMAHLGNQQTQKVGQTRRLVLPASSHKSPHCLHSHLPPVVPAGPFLNEQRHSVPEGTSTTAPNVLIWILTTVFLSSNACFPQEEIP